MINIDIIEREILELEAKDPSWAAVERLAWLYVVRDHLEPSIRTEVYQGGGTEFENACKGVEINKLMEILGEHMEALKLVYPKEYDSVIRRLTGV